MENSKHHIDRIFKNGINHYSVQPSADLWDRIEQELDNGMPTARSRASWLRYAAMVIVFFSIAMLSVPTNKQTPYQIAGMQQEMGSAVADQTAMALAEVTVASLPTANTSSTPIQFASNRVLDNSSPEDPVLQVLTADITIPVHAEEEFIFLPPEPEDEHLLAANQDILDRIYNEDEPIDVMAYNYLGDEEPEGAPLETPTFKAKYRDYDMRGLYVGATGSYNQTSILEYGNVFKGDRPIQSSLKFGTTKGFRVGYNINNSFGVEAEYIYNAIQGQNYVMSEGDVIVEKSLSLNYDLIPVVAKVKVGHISDITNKPVVMNYTAGVQYGMLREARMPQDKRYEESAMELFNDTDLSVVLGLEYDIYVQDNIVISAGARGTFSNDISTHIEPLNDYAKRNFVFGLRGGVSYVFR